MQCRVCYSLGFDLKIRSGQECYVRNNMSKQVLKQWKYWKPISYAKGFSADVVFGCTSFSAYILQQILSYFSTVVCIGKSVHIAFQETFFILFRKFLTSQIWYTHLCVPTFFSLQSFTPLWQEKKNLTHSWPKFKIVLI